MTGQNFLVYRPKVSFQVSLWFGAGPATRVAVPASASYTQDERGSAVLGFSEAEGLSDPTLRTELRVGDEVLVAVRGGEISTCPGYLRSAAPDPVTLWTKVFGPPSAASG